jgi:hypothetical protein
MRRERERERSYSTVLTHPRLGGVAAVASPSPPPGEIRLAAADTLKRYSKALEHEYRVKTATLGILKRYSIISLTLYLEWYRAYSILNSDRPH